MGYNEIDKSTIYPQDWSIHMGQRQMLSADQSMVNKGILYFLSKKSSRKHIELYVRLCSHPWTQTLSRIRRALVAGSLANRPVGLHVSSAPLPTTAVHWIRVWRWLGTVRCLSDMPSALGVGRSTPGMSSSWAWWLDVCTHVMGHHGHVAWCAEITSFWTKKRGNDSDNRLKQSCLEQSRQPWLVGLNRAEKVGVSVGLALRAYPYLCCSLLNIVTDVGWFVLWTVVLMSDNQGSSLTLWW